MVATVDDVKNWEDKRDDVDLKRRRLWTSLAVQTAVAITNHVYPLIIYTEFLEKQSLFIIFSHRFPLIKKAQQIQ